MPGIESQAGLPNANLTLSYLCNLQLKHIRSGRFPGVHQFRNGAAFLLTFT